MSRLEAAPLLSKDEAGLKVDLTFMDRNHVIEKLALPVFVDYPICDGAVALEHAVNAKDALPPKAWIASSSHCCSWTTCLFVNTRPENTRPKL